MAKVQTLNVLSDSNTLLRDEKDRLKEKVTMTTVVIATECNYIL